MPKQKGKRENTEKLRCIHCLNIPEFITDDHIIPQLWYEGAPTNTFKPVAPACEECNNPLGRLETELFHILSLSLRESHPLREQYTTKTYRAFGMGKTGSKLEEVEEKEMEKRGGYLKRMVSSLKSGSELNKATLLPDLGFHEGYSVEKQRGVIIQDKDLTKVIIKIIRGLEYEHGNKRYIEPSHVIEFSFDPEVIAHTTGMLENLTQKVLLGGCEIRRLQSPTDPNMVIYSMTILGCLKLVATISVE